MMWVSPWAVSHNPPGWSTGTDVDISMELYHSLNIGKLLVTGHPIVVVSDIPRCQSQVQRIVVVKCSEL